MTEVDYARCLTKAQVSAQANLSMKGIERAVRRGELIQYFRPQAGTSPVAVYFPEDVADFIAKRQPGPSTPVVVPHRAALEPNSMAPSSTNGNGHHPELPVRSLTISEPGAEWVRALVAGIVQVVSETSQTAAAYVNRVEALAIAGISDEELRKAVKAGEVKRRGRGYRVKDLEAL